MVRRCADAEAKNCGNHWTHAAVGPTNKAGGVSRLAMPRRARLSWLPTRECEPPARSHSLHWVVGKQSRNSKYNPQGSLRYVCDWFARLVALPDHANRPMLVSIAECVSWSSEQARLYRINTSGVTKTYRVFSSRSLRLNLLSLHELPSVASLKPLTKVVSARYAGVQGRRVECG